MCRQLSAADSIEETTELIKQFRSLATAQHMDAEQVSLHNDCTASAERASPEPSHLMYQVAAMTSIVGGSCAALSCTGTMYATVSPAAVQLEGVAILLILLLFAAAALVCTWPNKLNSPKKSETGHDEEDNEATADRPSKAQLKKQRDKLRATMRMQRERFHEAVKEEELMEQEDKMHELQRPCSHWRPAPRVARNLSRWTGGCRRKLYRQQRLRRPPQEQNKSTSLLMLAIAVLQSGDSMWELAALGIAATTVIASLSMMVCGTVATVSNNSSSLRKWNMNIKSMWHLIPSTSLCWLSATSWSTWGAPAAGGIIAAAVCYFTAAAWGAAFTTTASIAMADVSKAAWQNHWTAVYQNSRLRAKYTSAYVYLDTKIPSGVVRRKYLLDLGAAASVIPLSAFSEACMALKLSPSEAKLRGASGHSMKVEGEGQLLFMLPGTKNGVKHELQVTADGAMPEGLRILGIDFWHGLNSNVDTASQMVSGTTPDGEHFKLGFHVERGANEKHINLITAEHADSERSETAGRHDMILTDTIQVHPGQAAEV